MIYLEGIMTSFHPAMLALLVVPIVAGIVIWIQRKKDWRK